ncbi:xaa-Arg dipeptidase-like [Patella vulgata]|uniref:xaa-Arg dipeptidase-like n=1 Tax=Patella vulgata TaxID=6465 RepID=UPI0024A96959|nr:xaa-Arg dipeptidase-like [Patella vulgata]
MDITKLKTVAEGAVDKYKEELNELSQAIWSVPELNFSEHSAHRVLTEFLEKAGLKVERNFILETGFRATYGDDDSSKPNICVICEYDALPEIGHACGHNLIAEVGVATGLAIKAAMNASQVPLGKVTVLGTPAEEGGGGKIDLINAKVFDDIDVAMMSHPSTYDYAKPPTPSINQLVDYRFDDRPYSSLISNKTIVGLFETNAAEAGIELWDEPDPRTGSTDMGNVSHVVPRIHPMYSIGGKAANHTKEFTTDSGSAVAQSFTLKQAKVLEYTALDIYSRPELLKQIKQDFIKDLKNALS